METQQLKVGVIGLGAMGRPMADHLAAGNLLTAVWNRTDEKAAEAAGMHQVLHAASPAELAAQCNVILTCVSADADLLQVADRLLPGIQADTILLDTSTVSPVTAQTVADQLGPKGARLVDAPVSGGVEGAIEGRLSAMVGGDLADLSRIRPVLETFSATITHMGPVGSGQATKAVNQVIVGGVAEAVCEALALSEKLNLPPVRLLKVLGAGAAGGWFLEHRGQSMLENSFSKGFKLSLLLKDLRICQELARELDINMVMVENAIEDYQRLVEQGEGDNDISGLIRLKRITSKQES